MPGIGDLAFFDWNPTEGYKSASGHRIAPFKTPYNVQALFVNTHFCCFNDRHLVSDNKTNTIQLIYMVILRITS